MLNKLIKIVLPITIIVGCIIVGMGIFAGNLEGSVITQEKIEYNAGFQVYVWHYYKFHVDQYLLSIKKSLEINQLQYLLPQPPTLKDAPNGINVVDWAKFIANFLFVYLINWIIYIVNWVIIAPIKLLLYPLHIISALLGVDTNNSYVMKLFDTLYNIEIPLIPNFY